ncbi:DUF1707 domain-containing protein [Nocardioides lentus]|uniref:DUF1707 domain-containing protein n=1 Tax=Nocardioides lentus TaxID=338077 RepID=A0ABN2PDE9_9ACTN
MSHDPRLLRISDAERQQVAEALRDAAGDGRLDLDELEERLEATWSARTYADLEPVLADLPAQAPAPPGERAVARRGPAAAAATHAQTYDASTGMLSERRRTGVWRVPAEHTAVAVLGAVTLDLREAVFEARETTIVANTVLGSVEIVVDAETAVVVDGTPVLGDYSPVTDKVPPQLHDGSPVVRVRGVSLLGSVTVTRKAQPGRKRRRWF